MLMPNIESTRLFTLVVPADVDRSTLSKEKSESDIGSQAFADVVIKTSEPLHWNSLICKSLNSRRTNCLLDL